MPITQFVYVYLLRFYRFLKSLIGTNVLYDNHAQRVSWDQEVGQLLSFSSFNTEGGISPPGCFLNSAHRAHPHLSPFLHSQLGPPLWTVFFT